jgi:hypothetical protein
LYATYTYAGDSIEKMEEIGSKEVNRSKTFIKFYCQPVKKGDPI